MGKIEKRRRFLHEGCSAATREIHEPILDIAAVDGALNPACLGKAETVSSEGFGQSSLGFETIAGFRAADDAGLSPYHGAAEYAVVRSTAAAAVCEKMAALHCGVKAVICPSGLSAITLALEAFAPRAIAVPETVYRPLVRYVGWLNGRREANAISLFFYSGAASADEVTALIERAREAGTPVDMIYLEAPGSGTFEIPDIAGIAALAADRKIRTVMDNTWASHVRFKPLENGIDVTIQATTKYEGGYYDTPSGVVIARRGEDGTCLAYASRVLGIGAVSPDLCRRLYQRIDSAEARLDRQYQSALHVMKWFGRQPYVANILCPALPESADHERFLRYFGKGNGLFTTVFGTTVTPEQVERFIEALCLFRVAQGWGGHVSVVLPVAGKRELTPLPPGTLIRFHIGLEDPEDLVRDLTQAAEAIFSC